MGLNNRSPNSTCTFEQQLQESDQGGDEDLNIGFVHNHRLVLFSPILWFSTGYSICGFETIGSSP